MSKRQWASEFTLLCERCGYVLEGLPREGACPECGKPVAESVPERRVGTAWQRGASLGDRLRVAGHVVFHPHRTLDEATMDAGTSRGLWRLTHNLAALIGGGGVLAVAGIGLGGSAEGPIAWAWLLVLTMAGLFGLRLALSALTAIERLGLQAIGRTRGWRITPAIAQTIVAHGSVGWVIAALTGSVFGVLSAVGFDRVWNSRHFGVWFNWPVVFAGLALLGVLTGFMVFEVFAWLGARRLRFANRARDEALGLAGPRGLE